MHLPEDGDVSKTPTPTQTPTPTLARRNSSVKEQQRMTKEEREHEIEQHLKEQQDLLANFNVDNIEPHKHSVPGATVVWKDVSFSIKVPDPENPGGGFCKKANTIDKLLLDKCYGNIEPGSLVAIMGPSGCGKSTLLDILALKKTMAYSGDVFVNGHPIKGDPLFRRIAAYVSQEDMMPEHWTSLEAVEFNCLLKNPVIKGFTQANFRSLLMGVLNDVGLGHVANTKIGGPSVRGLSGGQKRRVTLARGMCSNPILMFADEPTSGLSATDAELCVKTLKLMTKRYGMTVLVVIHQPRVEVANLFTHLVLLTSQPGRVVYNGPMKDAPKHCAVVGYPVEEGANPYDHFLDVISPGAPNAKPDVFRDYYVEKQLPSVKTACDEMLANPGLTTLQILEAQRELYSQFGATAPVRNSSYAVGTFMQFKILLKRRIKLTIADPSAIGIIPTMAFLGLMIGIIYFGVGRKEPEGTTQLAYFMIFLNMMTLAPILPMPAMLRDRDIMKYETSEKLYSETAHICALLAVSQVLSLFAVSLMCLLMFALGRLPWASFPNLYYWAILNYFMMDGMVGFATGAAGNAESCNFFLMPFQFFAGLFNGFALSKVSAPVFLQWVFYISPVSYSMEDISHFNYGDNEEIWDTLVRFNGFEHNSWTLPIGTGLCLFFAVFGRVGQMYCLKYKHNIQK